MNEPRSARGPAVVLAILAFGLLVVGGLWYIRHGELRKKEELAADAAARTGMVVGALRGFPADAYGFGAIANLTEYGRKLGETALGKMIKDPEIHAKARAAAAVLGDSRALEDFDAALASAAEAANLGLRLLAFAVFPVPPPGPTPGSPDAAPAAAPATSTGFALVVACDDPAKVAAWLDAKLAAAAASTLAATDAPAAPAASPAGVASASPAPSESAGGALGPTPELRAEDLPRTPSPLAPSEPTPAPAAVHGEVAGVPFVCREALCRAVRANTVVVASPLAALRRMLETSPGAPSPAEAARVRTALEATDATTDSLFVFADLARLVDAARPSAPPGSDAARATELLGLGSLDSFAFVQHPEGDVFRERARLAYDAGRSGLLGALLDVPPGEIAFDCFLPAAAPVVVAARLPNLPALFDRLLAETRKAAKPEEAAKIDQALAALRGQAGIDLRNDVLAAFGGEWGMALQRLEALAQQLPALLLVLTMHHARQQRGVVAGAEGSGQVVSRQQRDAVRAVIRLDDLLRDLEHAGQIEHRGGQAGRLLDQCDRIGAGATADVEQAPAPGEVHAGGQDRPETTRALVHRIDEGPGLGLVVPENALGSIDGSPVRTSDVRPPQAG